MPLHIFLLHGEDFSKIKNGTTNALIQIFVFKVPDSLTT